MPAMAAPTPMPVKPISEIGGYLIRSAYFSRIGLKNWPPDSPPKPAPMSVTRGSAAKISSRASASAWANFNVLGICVLHSSFGGWQRAVEGELGRLPSLPAHPRVEIDHGLAINGLAVQQLAGEQQDRIALLLPLAHGFRGRFGRPHPVDVGVAADVLGEIAVVARPARGP